LKKTDSADPHPSVIFERVRSALIPKELCVICARRSVPRVRKYKTRKGIKIEKKTINGKEKGGREEKRGKTGVAAVAGLSCERHSPW
jgi:hypothetical protein